MVLIDMKRFFKVSEKYKVIRFIIVGGCSTFLDFLIYMCLSLKMPIPISKGISMASSSVFSYFLNKNYTFNNTDRTNVIYIIKFYFIFILNFGVNLGINSLFYAKTGKKVISFIVATVCGMIINYWGQNCFVFKKSS